MHINRKICEDKVTFVSSMLTKINSASWKFCQAKISSSSILSISRGTGDIQRNEGGVETETYVQQDVQNKMMKVMALNILRATVCNIR